MTAWARYPPPPPEERGQLSPSGDVGLAVTVPMVTHRPLTIPLSVILIQRARHTLNILMLTFAIIVSFVL